MSPDRVRKWRHTSIKTEKKESIARKHKAR